MIDGLEKNYADGNEVVCNVISFNSKDCHQHSRVSHGLKKEEEYNIIVKGMVVPSGRHLYC